MIAAFAAPILARISLAGGNFHCGNALAQVDLLVGFTQAFIVDLAAVFVFVEKLPAGVSEALDRHAQAAADRNAPLADAVDVDVTMVVAFPDVEFLNSKAAVAAVDDRELGVRRRSELNQL